MAQDPPPPPGRLYDVNAAAAGFYAAHLPNAETAAAYLQRHGITGASDPSEPWQLGYAPSQWTELANHLQRAGFDATEIVAAGLGFIHRRSRHLLDRFRDRLMFPITDEHNRIVAFTARDLSGRADARWLNSPETPVYRKRQVLYGLGQQLAYQPAGDSEPVVFLVEGAADVLALHRMATVTGYSRDARSAYTVAPCGTHLTREQLDLLHQHLPGAHLILAFDGDEAGRKAISRAYPIAATWPGQRSGARLPAGQDPADMLATAGPVTAMDEIIRATRPLAQVQMTNVIENLFARRRITDPTKYPTDRITAYRAIADLFVDEPPAARQMAEAAAEQLGVNVTDVTIGVVEAWDTRTIASGTDPPPTADPGPAPVEPPASQPGAGRRAGPDERHRTTVWASARATIPRAVDPIALVSRDNPTTGVTVWALADGIDHHPEAQTAATMAADIAATVALQAAPAAALHTARAAINAFYAGVHASQAGDASLIVIAAYPSPTTRHGVRFELAWAGNCRAYTLNAGHLAQVTTDHTSARHWRDNGESIHPGSLRDLLLTSSLRAGDISVCPLEHGPLLVCNNAFHRSVPDHTIGLELAATSDAQASADRLIAAGSPGADHRALLLIHARAAPPFLVTTFGPTPRATLTATGQATALAKVSFTSPAAHGTPSTPGDESFTGARSARTNGPRR